MEARELRIGNYVQWVNYKATTCIDEIHESGFNVFRNDDEFSHFEYSLIEGIPLTEEWLVKFGFIENIYEQQGSEFNKNIGNETFLVNMEEGIIACGYFHYLESIKQQHFSRLRELQYVHQLQNLYFAMTEEELTAIDR